MMLQHARKSEYTMYDSHARQSAFWNGRHTPTFISPEQWPSKV